MTVAYFNRMEITAMKYFTKEWYETCQKTGWHLSLEEDKHAETFSEEYFQQLYHQKLKDHLSSQEEFSSQTFDDVYPEQMPPEFIYESMSEAEILAQQTFYAFNREEAKNRFRPRAPFDKQKTSEQFHKTFVSNQERIEKTLPEAILNMIADIRLFVLDKASSEVITAVAQFCEGNMRTVNQTIEQYREYIKNVTNPFQRNILENQNFHDCRITGVKRTEHSLLILLESGGFTDIKEILFENYKIIKQDSPLENSWWLYDEIYDIDGRNEWHVLLQDKNLALADFIISAEKVSFKN